MVKSYAFTLKGVCTDRLYTIKDYRDCLSRLPDKVQVSPLRFELDSHRRLHVHGILRTLKSLPRLKQYLGYGWCIHTSAYPSEKWLSYILKDSDVSDFTKEYQQSLEWYRNADNMFKLLD